MGVGVVGMDPLEATRLWALIEKSTQVGAVLGGIIASVILLTITFRKAFSILKFFEVGNGNGNNGTNGIKDEKILNLRFENVKQTLDDHEERITKNERSAEGLHRRIDRLLFSRGERHHNDDDEDNR